MWRAGACTSARARATRTASCPSATTLELLRRFWRLHRNPVLLFPNRAGGLAAAASASTPLDRGGVQLALRKVVAACGLKKTITPHNLRRSAATHLIEARVDLLEVQQILGHHSILTTARSTHLSARTGGNAEQAINDVMSDFSLHWRGVK
jgi:site-specific recombinase XerD